MVALALAQDKKLQRSQLPSAVAATVDREAKGAQIKGFATERENGKQVYEAETVLNGHMRDLQIATDPHRARGSCGRVRVHDPHRRVLCGRRCAES